MPHAPTPPIIHNRPTHRHLDSIAILRQHLSPTTDLGSTGSLS